MANLDINFVGSKKKLHNQMLKEFKTLGRKALTMNHYDFAEVTSVNDPQEWKEFLQIPPISEYITEEFNAIQDSELRKLIMNISDSSSVGKAQLINAMQKQLKENPPINEEMIKTLMRGMGRNPSQKQVNQLMKQMQKYQ